jgi:MYXO-CTERM domain-containing protein
VFSVRVANCWRGAAPAPGAAHWQTATTLTDGRVLVVGGDVPLRADAYIYDPATNTWTTASPMNFARRHHRAVRLSDGRVLVVSGAGGTASGLPTAEIYDPVANTWTETSPMVEAHRQGGLVALPGGRILAVGGYDSSMAAAVTAAAEVYDVAADTWTAVAPMPSPRAFPDPVVLPSGDVFVAGGEDVTTGTVTLMTTAVYNPAMDMWRPGLSSSAVHSGVHTTVPLAGGRVLLAAGNTVVIGSMPVATSEIYVSVDPDGTACTSPLDCASGFCADGMCCNVACGSTSDCEACSVAAGAAVNGVCGTVGDGIECNDENTCTAADECTAGVCGGTPIPDACLCPAGTYSPDGTEITTCMPCPPETFSLEGAMECTAWTECAAEQYESMAPSAMANRECAPCTVCAVDEIEITACTPTTNRVCILEGTDAGMPGEDGGLPGDDAGRADGGRRPDGGARADAGPGGTPTPVEGGCECRADDASSGGRWTLAASLLVVAFVLRRRRR